MQRDLGAIAEVTIEAMRLIQIRAHLVLRRPIIDPPRQHTAAAQLDVHPLRR